MSSSIFRSLIRRRPSALAATMSHPRLIGSVSPQDGQDTQLKVVTTYFFEGFEASQIKRLVGLLQPYFEVATDSESLVKTINPHGVRRDVPGSAKFDCHSKISLTGYDDSEVDYLLESAQVADIPVGEVTAGPNNVVEVRYAKSVSERMD